MSYVMNCIPAYNEKLKKKKPECVILSPRISYNHNLSHFEAHRKDQEQHCSHYKHH